MSIRKRQTFKTLDNQMRILFWKLDEFFVMVIPIILGMFLGNILICFGSLLKIPYQKAKKKFAHREIKHYVYWNFPTSWMGHFKNMPPSHCRDLLL